MKSWQRRAIARPCYLAVDTLVFPAQDLKQGYSRHVTVNAGYE